MKKTELLLTALFLAGLIFLNWKIKELAVDGIIKNLNKTVVLDAGHGGEDPGKVGTNGALEKDINLQIVQNMKELLEEKGFSVVMTRQKDEMLCQENADNKKRADLKKRVEIINSEQPFLAVSIHQNSYEDADISGAQVFYYSESEEGKEMAEKIQNALILIDASNGRQAKANDSYYLLKETKVPVIIVECGFLSNPAEAEKLVTPEYQNTVSNAIVQGIESCFRN